MSRWWGKKRRRTVSPSVTLSTLSLAELHARVQALEAELERQNSNLRQPFPHAEAALLTEAEVLRLERAADVEKNSGSRVIGIFRRRSSLKAEQAMRDKARGLLRGVADARAAWEASRRNLELSIARTAAELEEARTARAKRTREEARRQSAVAREARRREKLEELAARVAAADGESRERAQSVRRRLSRPVLCPYCQGSVKEMEADHIMPVAKGGLSVDRNMIFVCLPCNRAKADQTLLQFCRAKGFDFSAVVERLEKEGKVV